MASKRSIVVVAAVFSVFAMLWVESYFRPVYITLPLSNWRYVGVTSGFGHLDMDYNEGGPFHKIGIAFIDPEEYDESVEMLNDLDGPQVPYMREWYKSGWYHQSGTWPGGTWDSWGLTLPYWPVLIPFALWVVWAVWSVRRRRSPSAGADAPG